MDEEVIYRGFRPGHVAGPARVFKIIVEAGAEDRQELTPGRSQFVWNHSPAGFQWGSAWSGAAQLALALLLDVTGDNRKSVKLHQAFKDEFVGRWGEQWQMTKKDIQDWITRKDGQVET